MAKTWFNESYYLSSKLAQLQKAEPTNSQWQGAGALVNLSNVLKAAGFTPEQHFLAFGSQELTSPNQYFNAEEYLEAKAAQANADMVDGKIDWTAASINLAIQNAGMGLYEHFQKFGWKEGVNPSKAFDVTQYLEAKLAQLQADEPEKEWTADSMEAAFEVAGFDPIAHYLAHGKTEGLSYTPANPETGAPAQSFTLTVGQDTYTGGTGADTFKANVVQNSNGYQVNTLGSGDELNGGNGIDTLNAKIASGAYAGGTANMPIQPETQSIEKINLQAVLSNVGPNTWSQEGPMTGTIGDQVYLNAKDMLDVKVISSNYSDADLTVMNMTTRSSTSTGDEGAARALSDMTVNMSYTGNADSRWNASDFSVYFDQDYLTPGNSRTPSWVEFRAMNEDGYDATAGESPLAGVFFRKLQFTLNGELFELHKYLEEDEAGLGEEISTYDDLLAAVEKALAELKADNADNAALQSVEASFGSDFTSDISPVLGELREGQSIRLTVDGETDGENNVMNVSQTDLEVARVSNPDALENNNRFERAENATSETVDELLAINVELEKVGLAGDGGMLVIGSMNKDSSNTWDAKTTVVDGTISGIEQFNVTVKGDASKSSSLAGLHSTNNNLRVVNIVSADTASGTYANLTIGNSNTPSDEYEPQNSDALKDVQILDASKFKGDLTVTAGLTNEIVAKYLDRKDQATDAPDADNVLFAYTGGTGNDSFDLEIASSVWHDDGTATREDFELTIDGGAGDDLIFLDLQIGNDDGYNGLAEYLNQSLMQAENTSIQIFGGDGNDTIVAYGSGDVFIDAGAGDDVVYADNSGDNADWTFNNVLGSISGVNNTYALLKTSVQVSYLGFEQTVEIVSKNGVVTDLDINQAVKKAINDEGSVLSKLLEAHDDQGNSLHIESLIDGERYNGDLVVTLVAPAAGKITVGDIAATNWATVAQAEAAIAATVATFNSYANVTYLVDGDGYDEDSEAVSDNTIIGGLGNDVLVLGTGAFSNDTLVYEGYENGTDTIVNFDSNWEADVVLPVPVGTPARPTVLTLTFADAANSADAQTIDFDGFTIDLSFTTGTPGQAVIPGADVAYQFAKQYEADNGTWEVTHVTGTNQVTLTAVSEEAEEFDAATAFDGSTYEGITAVVTDAGQAEYAPATAATFTLILEVPETTVTAADDVTFDGATISFAAGDGAVTMAEKLVAATLPNWTAEYQDFGAWVEVYFTANDTGALTEDEVEAVDDFAGEIDTIGGVALDDFNGDLGYVFVNGTDQVGDGVEVDFAFSNHGADYLDFSDYGIDGVIVNGVLVAGAAATAGNDYIALVESTSNAGSYTVTHYTEAGATDTVVGVIGTLDFGSTQAFVAENFII